MKKKLLNTRLSLSKETVRSLASWQLDRAIGGYQVPTGDADSSCATACAQVSCAACGF